MWFGTRDGLNRFDGNGITIYRNNSQDTASISDNYISSIFEDKPWMTVDPTNGNRVLVSWTRFTGTSDMIMFTQTVNGGANWSTPIQINPAAFNGAVQGSQIGLDATGHVYILYVVAYVGGIFRQYISTSSNGGLSFSPTTLAAVTPYYYGLNFSATYRTPSFASMAIAPSDGTIHVSYSAMIQGFARVMYTRSTNHGVSFTTPSTPLGDINSTRGHQFQSAIAADTTVPGRVVVTWYDTRAVQNSSRYLDIYSSTSTNNGLSWPLLNARVTPTTTYVGTAPFMGDYSGLAACNGIAYPAFAFFVTPLRTAKIT